MMRFICEEVCTDAAIHVGGPVVVDYITFTDVEKLEAWLKQAEYWSGTSRRVIGAEQSEPETSEFDSEDVTR